MFRFLFRLLGLVALATAFILIVYDGTRSIAGNAVTFTNVRDVWAVAHSPSLQAAQPLADRLMSGLWEAAAVPVLLAPAAAFFAVIGIVLLLLGRRKKPLIGYAR